MIMGHVITIMGRYITFLKQAERVTTMVSRKNIVAFRKAVVEVV